VLRLRDRCRDAGVPFFFKQWGGVRKSAAGRELDGRTYDEIPSRSVHSVLSREECLARAAEIEASLDKPELLSAASLLDPIEATFR
jgi:hypothetical protein